MYRVERKYFAECRGMESLHSHMQIQRDAFRDVKGQQDENSRAWRRWREEKSREEKRRQDKRRKEKRIPYTCIPAYEPASLAPASIHISNEHRCHLYRAWWRLSHVLVQSVYQEHRLSRR